MKTSGGASSDSALFAKKGEKLRDHVMHEFEKLKI